MTLPRYSKNFDKTLHSPTLLDVYTHDLGSYSNTNLSQFFLSSAVLKSVD